MAKRWQVIGILILLLGISAGVLNRLNQPRVPSTGERPYSDEIDRYLNDSSILFMRPDGTLKGRLYADYMAHYPNNRATKLTQPKLEIDQPDSLPVIVVADRGWINDDSRVASLYDNVNLWQHSSANVPELKVITKDARILIDQEYVETERSATVIGQQFVIDSIGMKAYLQQNRIEFMSDVHAMVKVK